jgi:hypothetical protein
VASAKKKRQTFNVETYLGTVNGGRTATSNYKPDLEVHNSLLNVILHHRPQIRRDDDTGK